MNKFFLYKKENSSVQSSVLNNGAREAHEAEQKDRLQDIGTRHQHSGYSILQVGHLYIVLPLMVPGRILNNT